MASLLTTALAGNFARDSWQALALNPSVEDGAPRTRKNATNAPLACLQTTPLVERLLLHPKEQLQARTGRQKAREARAESLRAKEAAKAKAEMRLLTFCQKLTPTFTLVKLR